MVKELELRSDPVSLDLMHSLRNLIDPDCKMNPGSILSVRRGYDELAS
ncbi:hypothetical protein HED63_25345 [Ochrobactrum cytisi]|nr:hypothetical protein [Brucella cytisi]